MEGVIIQTERVYRQVPIATSVIMIVIMAAYLAWYLLYTVRYCKKHKDDTKGYVIAYSFVSLICVIASIFLISGTLTIHNDLIVTIDDSVSFNEFTERYEVVSKDGNLYTVRDLVGENEGVADE